MCREVERTPSGAGLTTEGSSETSHPRKRKSEDEPHLAQRSKYL